MNLKLQSDELFVSARTQKRPRSLCLRGFSCLRALDVSMSAISIAAESVRDVGRVGTCQGSADCPCSFHFDATAPKPEAKAGKSAIQQIANLRHEGPQRRPKGRATWSGSHSVKLGHPWFARHLSSKLFPFSLKDCPSPREGVCGGVGLHGQA